MKLARCWLVVTALVLAPTAALAQKKPTKPSTTKPSTPPTGAAAGGAGSGGGEIELDEPAPAPAPAGPTAPAPGTAPNTAVEPSAPTGGICEIDPSACPKQEDIKAAVDKSIAAEIYAVQQIYALRARRFEVMPYFNFTLNDQFVSHDGPGLALNYYITNVLAFGVNGNLYSGLNSEGDFNFENRRAARVTVPLNEYQWGANGNFTYVPMYGKFAGIGDFIFHYDAYVVGGMGVIATRPIPVIDPDNRNFSFKTKLDFNVGIGLRIFLNRWFGVDLEVRDYIYNEQIEALSVANGPVVKPSDPGYANSPSNPSTWYEKDGRLTNNIQAQIGISIFLPFSWEYRLPK